MNPCNFFAELKRRNVYKVAVAYGVVAWLVIQISDTVFPRLNLPDWAVTLVIVLLLLGLPVAVVLAWAFELTPEGVVRAEEVTPDKSIARKTGRKLTVVIVLVGVLAATLFALQFVRSRASSAPKGVEKVAVAEKSIAVLPFENRSEDKANAYFADGIQDEILTRLAQINDLKVISRTSTQRYKSSPENLPEIARQLGVAHILEGSVQKAGEQVRVNVQLINAETDAHLWAEVYDRKLTDIFTVQTDIAENIAKALQMKLSGREQQAVAAKPTENPAAYEAYLRGLALWNTLSTLPEDSDTIVAHFSRAVELDPEFALAWSFLSVAHSFVYVEFDGTPQRAARGKEALERALSLQPDLGEAHFAEGMYRYKILRDYEGALAAFQKARAGSAANRVMAIEFSSYVKRRQGKWDEAIQMHRATLELDPRNVIILSEAALTYRALRRFDEAHALLDRAREVDPQAAQLIIQKAEVALAQGDTATAARLMEAISIDPRDPVQLNASVRYWLTIRRFPEAIRTLRDVLQNAESLPKKYAANFRALLGIAEALAGNQAAAKAKLEGARRELLAVRAEGVTSSWINGNLLLVAAFLKDKAGVEREAAELRDEIESDAVVRNSWLTAIAVARAQLGETDAALESVKQLLKLPGEYSLTPALLRIDPLWDPLRDDPRFQKLVETKL